MKINIMENNDFIEGWVATDVDGTHLFVNKPYRAKFGNHFSWVGYQIKDADSLALRAKSELNIKDNDEPIKVKININAEIAEESVVIATEHFVSNWPAKRKFDYTPIDLGLPSGTLWCNRNVGAKNTEDYGLYFAWGETKGYSDLSTFSESHYRFSIVDKYANRSELLLEDDAAHVNMGDDWHMPTAEQIQELIENTTHTVEVVNSHQGMRYTSKKDWTKSIFVPFAGYCSNGIHENISSDGIYWSSSRHDNVNNCYSLYCNRFGGEHIIYSERYCGFSVRGVIG